MYRNVSEQEEKWPQVSQDQVLQRLEESCQEVSLPRKKGAGRPVVVSWRHLCLAMMTCFLRGWNSQLEVWRLICGENVGGFGRKRVSDQAIYNRIERSQIALALLFDHVSAWIANRSNGWNEKQLAPWASDIYAADASTLDRIGRWLTWLRPLVDGDPSLLAGKTQCLV